jgi:hypothetical protein
MGRSVITPAHSVLRALALTVVLSMGSAAVVHAQAGAGSGSGENSEISLEQARQLAIYALQNGDPGLAIRVSRGLLQADPRDPLAYFVIAQAHAGLNQPNLGRRAAARAYRFTKDDGSRFQAAQLAAKMAYLEGKPSLAQVWLRRTALYAPGESEERAVARDYRALRAINPMSFRLRLDARPSNNVNNGSDTALNIIDGIPDGGTTPAVGRALSGVIGSVDLAGTYRLRGDKASSTTLGGRLYVQRVALSNAARDLLASAPVRVGNSNFASTYGEVSLRHVFAVGDVDKGGTAVVELAVGESWYAQDRSYRFTRLQGERRWRTGQGRTQITLLAQAEDRTKARYSANEARILGLGAKVQRRLDSGDSVGVTLALRDTDAANDNGTFTSVSMRTNYSFARSVGPAKLSTGLVLGYSDYPVYNLTFPPRPFPRTDKSIYADVSLFFDRYDYAGFAPLLRIRTGKKFSNFSRFESRELSVSLSVQSKF